jgi:acylphosphatase
MSHARVHCIVHGRVQGVAFRANTQHQARRLGLTGWVRNCSDGTVELLAQGETSSVQQLVTWCQHGPPGAHVTRVEVSWEPPGENLPAFDIRYY